MIKKEKIIPVCVSLIFLLTNLSHSLEKLPFENLVVHKKPITYENIEFEDIDGNLINLNNKKNNLIILNFWTVWCAPCKEEMPYLDTLSINKKINNLKIFPINLEKKNLFKAKKFFEDLKINNLSIFFDTELKLVKRLALRGVPTTIFIDRKGREFARIIGLIDFSDEKFVNWLSKY